jgi:hypothetical protein
MSLLTRKYANYQLHVKKTYPYGIVHPMLNPYTMMRALKYAIEHEIRFISKDTILIWENPYLKERK